MKYHVVTKGVDPSTFTIEADHFIPEGEYATFYNRNSTNTDWVTIAYFTDVAHVIMERDTKELING